jgi:glycine cleavage system H protein
MNIPSELKYAKTDEWVKVEGTTATLGISDFAQEQFSDIIYVEYTVSPKDKIQKDTAVVTLESVKHVDYLHLPVSGTVLSINEALPDSPEIVNSDPYGKAWMVKIQMDHPSDLDGLMDAAAYTAFCEERNH